MISLFIFRRDLRLVDNIALIECYKESSKIIPIFIFTPEQITKNEYFSSNAFQFMLESLDELDKELKSKYNSQLHYFYGDNIKILNNIMKKDHFDAIFFNKDYTPYARDRDAKIESFCKDNNKKCYLHEDYLLLPIGHFLKKDGKAYEKYTPFKNNAKKLKVMKPNNYKLTNSKFHKIQFDVKNIFNLRSSNFSERYIHGGRINALKVFEHIKDFKNYSETRNTLITPTTHLSAYIKFGCLSIREVYEHIHKLFGMNHGLIDQLYWREFYYYLAYYIPRVLEGKSLKEQYDKIEWGNKYFEEWKNGLTGFPIVDAGMRELNSTGFMHNRARLITSGILIKILNCDWRLGEKYFATKLVDYDPSVNNGNWQWSSGSGADSQPYFRVMSPWKQGMDNDPDALYIKKWIPELKDIPAKDILNWDKSYSKYKDKIDYPCPIVDYNIMRKEIILIYKKGIELSLFS